MRERSAPRLGAGVHKSGGFCGEREAVRWDILFPRGRRGALVRWCCVGVAAAVAVGGVILWLALRGSPADGGPADGGDPSHGVGGLPETTGSPADTLSPADTDESASSEEETEAEGTEAETTPAPPVEEDTAVPAETTPAEDGETDAAPAETSADPSEGTDPPPAETDTTPEPPSETEEETRPIPEGCYPVIPEDVSETERGVGYLVGEVTNLPAALPREDLWSGDTLPAVLLVHTHPFEGYGDGKAWYDPASGGFARTESVYDPDGVVALGAALARELRAMGVTVMHLRIAVTAEDTAAEIYERTCSAVASYLTLYPDIGLVLDLRRSAELTGEGGILRTMGKLAGDTCAQVRISVNGNRPEDALGRDLTAALALRESLWQTSPTISRPVWVKAGDGVAGERSGVCALTLELGSAGNTYAEAARLITPLAEAVGSLLGGGG